MNRQTTIGIDMGATNFRAGLVENGNMIQIVSRSVTNKDSIENVLEELFSLIDEVINDLVISIGIGVPGLVDPKNGVVFDVINIPGWQEVPLQQLLFDRYQMLVKIDNDANCFALGEFHFGKGKGYESMIGVTIGSGLGTGIILNKKLYTGKNGAAGEFGMIPYLDKYFEYYASGQFFQNKYGLDGNEVFKRAGEGHQPSIKMYEEMGTHLGNAINAMLYALDIELIVFGGSVRNAYPYFSKAMWQQIQTLAFRRTVNQLKIEVSELENAAILGATQL
jgi:glucokinase